MLTTPDLATVLLRYATIGEAIEANILSPRVRNVLIRHYHWTEEATIEHVFGQKLDDYRQGKRVRATALALPFAVLVDDILRRRVLEWRNAGVGTLRELEEAFIFGIQEAPNADDA